METIYDYCKPEKYLLQNKLEGSNFTWYINGMKQELCTPGSANYNCIYYVRRTAYSGSELTIISTLCHVVIVFKTLFLGQKT